MEILNSWLEQVQAFVRRLGDSRMKIVVVERDVNDAKKMLALFQKNCLEQVERNKERLVNIYNIEEISNLSEISAWKQEVTLLIKVFESDTDNEYLILIQKQLDLLEKHFNVLDDSELDDQQFQRLLQQCEEETKMFFDGDDPPLDSEAIYASICESLQTKRSGLATIWMENHIPPLNSIKKFDASKALQTISSLQKRPKLLSADQVSEVRKVITACEMRIDEFEVDGLLAKFQGMSDQNKKAFIQKIETDIRAYINSIA